MFKELGAVMGLLGNKGKLQEEMAKFQSQVGQITADGAAGGGLVTVKANGKLEIVGVKLAADAPSDRELLEDLIAAAANQALAKVREQLHAETAKVAANLGLPAGMLGALPGMS